MAGVKQRKGDGNGARVRMLHGKIVTPVAYGAKLKMVGEVDGKMVVDKSGKPIPFKSIGELVAK
jgi:hypothetical protein